MYAHKASSPTLPTRLLSLLAHMHSQTAYPTQISLSPTTTPYHIYKPEEGSEFLYLLKYKRWRNPGFIFLFLTWLREIIWDLAYLSQAFYCIGLGGTTRFTHKPWGFLWMNTATAESGKD